MPPKGSKKPVSPAKGTAATRKASAARAKSPVKEAGVQKASPKKATSPKKAASPEKTAVYKTAMTRATRGATAAPDEPPPTRSILYKRGLLGENDNDDDPTQPTEEMLALFDKRSLTQVDKFMIQAINRMEEADDHRAVNQGVEIKRLEKDAAAKGVPLNCHTKIYWRFFDMYVRRNEDDQYPFELSPGTIRYGVAYSDREPPSKEPAHRRRLRAPAGRAAVVREISETSMSRPVREGLKKSRAPAFARDSAGLTAGPSRVSKAQPLAGTSSSRSARSRSFAKGASAGGDRSPYTGATDEIKTLTAFEQAAFDSMMAGVPPPMPSSRSLSVDLREALIAQERGVQAAMKEHVRREAAGEGPVPTAVATKLGRNTRAQSPGKRATSSRAQSPAKPHSHTRSQSPAKLQQQTVQQSPGRLPGVRRPSIAPSVDVAPVREPGRGHLVSSQNPEKIEVNMNGKIEIQDNNFFESMPAPEVWHRRMPPVFPFGETPFMARVVSDQINADLARNHEDDDTPAAGTGLISGIKGIGQRLGSLTGLSPTKVAAKEAERAKKLTSMWELPEVDESYREEIRRAAKQYKAGKSVPPPRQKRPAPEPIHEIPFKRARGLRRGEGERPMYG